MSCSGQQQKLQAAWGDRLMLTGAQGNAFRAGLVLMHACVWPSLLASQQVAIFPDLAGVTLLLPLPPAGGNPNMMWCARSCQT